MFEDNKGNKDLSYLRTGQFETERGNATYVDLSLYKKTGIIGTILLAISAPLYFSNYFKDFNTNVIIYSGYIYALAFWCISLVKLSTTFNSLKFRIQSIIMLVLFEIAALLVFIGLTFHKDLTVFIAPLFIFGMISLILSFNMVAKYTGIMLYKTFAISSFIAYIISLFLFSFPELMRLISLYVLWSVVFIILIIAFYTTPTKMREDENIYIPSKKPPDTFDFNKTSESLKSAVEDIDTNQPVMVLRYTFFRTLSLVLFYLFCFLMFLGGTLTGFGIVPLGGMDDNLYRFLCVTFAPFATIFALWEIIDLVNTKQIEVYRDRVVKRVTIPFPMQRDKTVYYKEGRYRMNSMGMYITEAKGISAYIRGFKGFYIYTSRFKGKDETRFIKFLAQVSGRDEGIFCRPLSHIELFYQKFMKE
ncbi:hypothetical protein TDSAC_0072 [Thermodesulfobium acidiphilum]|uniref:Uncharacterized protein n=1 Tax=Thermodesulfobium acidiphilum TaxID=1794699 RepID=A0A2R4VY91_THEAF|nr:hypothetical protein [Thermodesulfobium acidiphilum]AWB09462.1 hypothetical protein TDSAC_0072 [Thermodesulfobium acidiphilum]